MRRRPASETHFLPTDIHAVRLPKCRKYNHTPQCVEYTMCILLYMVHTSYTIHVICIFICTILYYYYKRHNDNAHLKVAAFSPYHDYAQRRRWRCGGEEDPDGGGSGSGKDVVVVPRVGGKPVSLVGSVAAAAAIYTRSRHTHTHTNYPYSHAHRNTWFTWPYHLAPHRSHGQSS